MLFGKKHKPRERFYLLPGQGGRSYRQKQRVIMRWTYAVALFSGLALAVALWWYCRPRL